VLLIRMLTEGLGYHERPGNWLTTSGFLRLHKSVSIKVVPSIVQRYRFEAREARGKRQGRGQSQISKARQWIRRCSLGVTAFRPPGYAEVVRGLRAFERAIAVHRPRRKAEAFGEQSGLKWMSHGV
jgi:hypothetical protein